MTITKEQIRVAAILALVGILLGLKIDLNNHLASDLKNRPPNCYEDLSCGVTR
jgi:hypothetical protein